MPLKVSSLKASDLKTLLTLIGSSNSGTKKDLLSRLSQDIQIPRLRPVSNKKSLKILSIDMGIKNMAYCVADVNFGSQPRRKEVQEAKMKVVAWRRMDVAEEVGLVSSSGDGNKMANLPEDEFSPSALSHTAYTLLTKILLPHSPDIILIERQRWRSGGGTAIQEWTVRVNMLEGIFWALLTCFQKTGTHASGAQTANGKADVATTNRDLDAQQEPFQVFDVNPKRVGRFWIDTEGSQAIPKSLTSKRKENELELGPEGEVEEVLGGPRKAAKPLSRGKAEKKAKIQLVQSWLISSSPSTSSTNKPPTTPVGDLDVTNTPISFDFSPDAELTRKALFLPSSRKKDEKDVISRLKKLDDVSDCLLQAAAWVAWEGNRVRLLKEWEEGKRMSKVTATEEGAEKKVRGKRKGTTK